MERRETLGKLMVTVGTLLLVPLVMLLFYPEERFMAKDFLIPAAVSALAGLVVMRTRKKAAQNRSQQTRRSAGMVVGIWAWAILMGSLPFVLSGQLNLVQGIFESTSGWTTAGLSVMDVETTSRLFLFFRSFMQFAGGLGFVFVVLLIVHGKDSMNLYQAEGHADMLSPALKSTARKIACLYMGMLVVGTAALTICGMSLFDAVNNAMCALSTGGFSTRADSIGAWHSDSINIVTIVLMLIGTTNFAALFLILKGKFKQFFKISEVRFLGLLLVVFVPLTAFLLCKDMHMAAGEGLMQSAFNLISGLSTAGFSLGTFDTWPPAALIILILMMLIGGGAGSTAGGIKLSRVYLLLRNMVDTLVSKAQSKRQVRIQTYERADGKTEITKTALLDTSSFVTLYLTVFIAGSILLAMAAGCSAIDALFEFASALGTVGLSIGVTSASAPASVLIIETVGMLLGRLEIAIVLLGLGLGKQ